MWYCEKQTESSSLKIGGLVAKALHVWCYYTYVHSCKQLTETFGSKRPAPKYLSTVVYCSTRETPNTNTTGHRRTYHHSQPFALSMFTSFHDLA